MAITLGPILFNWPYQQKLDFYKKIANDSSVKTVYVGEVVCQKRFVSWGNVYDDIVEMLLAANKQVIISSLALINTEKELAVIDKYAKDKRVSIEVNDVGALQALTSEFCIGPYVNVYNANALEFYAKKGATHICLVPELPLSSIKALKSVSLPKEIIAFGRLPLAISARCAHARVYKQTKSNCRYVCEKDLNGLSVQTLDAQNFLTINGLQTMSSSYVNLLNDIQVLKQNNISRFRVSPHFMDMVKVLDIFMQVDADSISAKEGMDKIKALDANIDYSNGFLYEKPGYAYQYSKQEKD